MLEDIGDSQERNESLLLHKLSKGKSLVRFQSGLVEPRPCDLQEALRRLFAKKNVIGQIIFCLFISPQASQKLLQARRTGGDLSRWLGTVSDKPGRMNENCACRLDYRLQIRHSKGFSPQLSSQDYNSLLQALSTLHNNSYSLPTNRYHRQCNHVHPTRG